jgi:hypothetical protein
MSTLGARRTLGARNTLGALSTLGARRTLGARKTTGSTTHLLQIRNYSLEVDALLLHGLQTCLKTTNIIASLVTAIVGAA